MIFIGKSRFSLATRVQFDMDKLKNSQEKSRLIPTIVYLSSWLSRLRRLLVAALLISSTRQSPFMDISFRRSVCVVALPKLRLTVARA